MSPFSGSSRLRGVVAAGGAIALALAIPRFADWALAGPVGALQAWLILGAGLVAMGWLVGGQPDDSIEARPVWSRRQRLLLFVLAFGLFAWFAQREMTFSPPLVSTEARGAMVWGGDALASAKSGRLVEFLRWNYCNYNVGLGPLAVPVVWVFGLDPLPYHWLYIVFYGLLLAGTLACFSRGAEVRGLGPAWPWVLLPLAALTIVLPSLRALKWHSMGLAGALGLLIVAQAWSDPRGRNRVIGGLLLILFGLVHYHVTAVFLLGAALLIPWSEWVVRPKPARFVSRWGILACVGLIAAGWIIWSISRQHASIDGRILVESQRSPTPFEWVRPYAIGRGLLDLLNVYLPWPTCAAVLLGLATAFRRLREVPTHFAALLGLAMGLSIQIAFGFIGDLSWNCSILVPLTWLAAVGVLELARGLRNVVPSKVAISALLAAAMAVLLGKELPAFADKALGPRLRVGTSWNFPESQLAGLVAQLQLPGQNDAGTLHLIASLAISGADGGFEHDVPLSELDCRAPLGNLREYDSVAQLEGLLKAFQRGQTRWRQMVVYYRVVDQPTGDDPTAHLPFLPHSVHRTDLLALPSPSYGQPLHVTRLTFGRGERAER